MTEPRKIEVRKHLTRRHAPVRRTTFPQVLPPTAATWLLRSSHHHHGSLHRHDIFHLTKFGYHLTSHTPPRADDISGEILHPDPRACSIRMTCTHDPTRSESRPATRTATRPIRDPPKLPATYNGPFNLMVTLRHPHPKSHLKTKFNAPPYAHELPCCCTICFLL
uniref:Uncharacterized protein n=1 Tax=Fagus sylvatica TaxID=28930 RepID=A0A2N9H0L7_FAGSY